MVYPLPLIVRLGTMVRPIEQLTVLADVNWQRWKTFDRLVVDFDHNYELSQTPGAFMSDVVIDNHWRDTLTARLGFDAIPVPDPERLPLHVRAGVLFDQGAVPDRTFDVMAPDSDKLGVSAGLGYSFRLGSDRVWMDIDVAYMHLFLAERDIHPVRVGPDELEGNDGDEKGTNDTQPNPQQEVIPGSDKTIVNKPAPSFFHGVTRASFDILGLGVAIRIL
jgi:long-subunit fatty acid transport protein